MLVNTSTLTGPALNFAVATAQGLSVSFADWYKPDEGCQLQVSRSASGIDSIYWHLGGRYDPAGDWAQGGPLLTEARISRTIDHSGLWIAYWTDGYGDGDEANKFMHCDRSELVAGMRTFVAGKLGDTVEIPDELADTQPIVTLNRRAVWPFR